MKKHDHKKREAPISYRPPRELRDEFHARVQKSGLSVSAFITKSVFDCPPPRQSRRPPVEEKQLARLLAEAARIRTQLHEFEQAGQDSDYANVLDNISRSLADIRTLLLTAMGRSP
ncbi:hypothetical protein KG088_17830 [Halomonas sp. TRM85114]|uniref:hypothetical protein n=1 Tax=Halomonas jincaotanensis TaxID=2810616 RepID=UPI001BD6C165|nr:hypothetical protein [Halomonas jincaotanensis]MBS9405467.1 hypothetical protein [Halomonas jincaotanensis]